MYEKRTFHQRSGPILLALAVFLAGCPDGGEDTGIALPSCDSGTMKLEGTVADFPLMLQDATQGGYSQDDDGGEFQTQQGRRGGLSHDPAVIDVRLTWTGGALEDAGSRSIAIGDALLPTKVPMLGGTHYCVGTGSTISQVSSSELRYRLRNLKGGTDCHQAVPGELRGCWHSRNP